MSNEKSIENVLCIPDLHLPFNHNKALDHCIKTYIKYKCNRVIFLGDLIDNSQTSRWDPNPNSKSPLDELKISIKKLKPWYETFKEATVTIGNHELRILKKLQRNSIASIWMKEYKEVLEVPNWNFVDQIILNNVKYIHGEGYTNTLQSILYSEENLVFGHLHTKFELIYTKERFAMCLGWLGDRNSSAFSYAKSGIKQQQLGCGVILENGTLPILIPLL